MMLLAQCPICTDLFDGERCVSALKCGHVFHHTCINTWTYSNRSCPQCRTKVVASNTIQLYFDKADPNNTTIKDDAFVLNIEIKQLQDKLGECDNTIMMKEQTIQSLSSEIATMTALYNDAQNFYDAEKGKVKQLQAQLNYCSEEVEKTKNDILEANRIKQKFKEMKNIQTLIDGEEAAVEKLFRELLQDKPPSTEIVRQLCQWLRIKIKSCETIKKENKELKKTIVNYSKYKLKMSNEIDLMKSNLNSSEKIVQEQKEMIVELEKEISSLRQSKLPKSDTELQCKALKRKSSQIHDWTPEPSDKHTKPTIPSSSNRAIQVDMNESVDMFSLSDTPDLSKSAKSSIKTSDDDEFEAQVEIRKAYAVNPFKKTPLSKSNSNNSAHLNKFNLFRRNITASGSIPHYPNGFGGRENAWSLKPSSSKNATVPRRNINKMKSVPKGC